MSKRNFISGERLFAKHLPTLFASRFSISLLGALALSRCASCPGKERAASRRLMAQLRYLVFSVRIPPEIKVKARVPLS